MLLLFSLLGMSPFSLARPTKCSFPPPPLLSPPKYCLLHPSPPFPLQLCVGSRVWVGVGVCPQSLFFTCPFLLTLAWDRMAWAWASWADTTGPFSPSPPKRNCWTHKQTQALKLVLFLFVCTIRYPWFSLTMELYDKSWLFLYVLVLLYSEHLLAASAWYQGAQPHHQHRADQHDQEDPAIQKRHNQIFKKSSTL